MKRFLAAVLLIVTALPVHGQEIVVAASDMARTLALEMKEQGKTRVAVATFRDHLGAVTPVGAFFAEELTSQLLIFKGNSLTVVERSRTDAVFAEQKLGLDGLRESKKLDAFVKILQVDALVVGTITKLPELGNRMRINARLIGVPSGEGLASASVFVPLTSLPDSLPSVPPPPPAPQAGQVASQDLKGVTYELLGCTKTDRTVMCQLVVTNNLADRTLEVHLTPRDYERTFLYDQRGYYFGSTRLVIGDVDTTDVVARKFLIAGIPTSLRIYFKGVPPTIEFIKIFQLGTRDGPLEFRNIAFVDNL